uniref:Uncharacterized protein n=1 Tax=viral metagenome TaxID=1070528 RepID=A0A6C0ENX7_9ZZZZ
MDKRDEYGFLKKYNYDRTLDYPVKKSSLNIKKIVLYTLLILTIILSISSMSLSGYIAWNQFLSDPAWLKIYKTSLAVIFSPIYLSFMFIKSIIFRTPN